MLKMDKKYTDNTFNIYKYEHLFSDEFINEILKDLNLPSEDFNFAKKVILGAASHYKMRENAFYDWQKTYSEEKKQLKSFIKKSQNFRESYEKTVGTGYIPSYFFKYAAETNIFENKHPKSVKIFKNISGCDDKFLNSAILEDILLIFEELSETIVKDKNLNKTYRKSNKNELIENWVYNIYPLFEISSVPFTQGTHDKPLKMYTGQIIPILLKLIAPLNSEVTSITMGNLVKDFNTARNKQKQPSEI